MNSKPFLIIAGVTITILVVAVVFVICFSVKTQGKCLFVCSRGILNLCDVKSAYPISDSSNLDGYDFSKISEKSTVYICSSVVNQFIKRIDEIKCKFILYFININTMKYFRYVFLFLVNNSCNGFTAVTYPRQKTSNILSVGQIRLELLQEYFKYLNKYEAQIVDILISEGKKTLGDQVKGKTMDFTHFIYNEDYYITNFDVWLILEKYKIPSVFISSKSILQANNQDKVFVAYGEKEDNFCFIVTEKKRKRNGFDMQLKRNFS
jgi:hypothetical protein